MKFKTLVALSLFTFAFAFADDAMDGIKSDVSGDGTYGMAGCGLGSMVFQDNTMFNQILAATTNGTFGSQTFGITSGTSNCTSNGLAMVEKEAEMFAEMNLDNLLKEFSMGSGETVDSFANLLGCSETSSFANAMKSNYSSISTAKTGSALLNKVQSTISADEALSKSCSVNG